MVVGVAAHLRHAHAEVAEHGAAEAEGGVAQARAQHVHRAAASVLCIVTSLGINKIIKRLSNRMHLFLAARAAHEVVMSRNVPLVSKSVSQSVSLQIQ